jgi:hypothetical protein
MRAAISIGVHRKEKSDMDIPSSITDGFIVPDPHIVYYDAVMHSPWDHDGGGHLPEKDDWSTYRYTVKDIILGIVTHRFNKNTRRLEIRAYFVGEHPIFKELEPTKAILTVLFCQSYQSGGGLELFFELGIPFDVIELIRKLQQDGKLTSSCSFSGLDQLIGGDTGSDIYAALSDFSHEIQGKIIKQEIDLDRVCFNTYRGTWSSNHIKTLICNGVPLRWLFKEKPGAIKMPIIYSHLVSQLTAALLEEYAVRRLEDRQMGESFGNAITRFDEKIPNYSSAVKLLIDDGESFIDIPEEKHFSFIPVISRMSESILNNIHRDIERCKKIPKEFIPVIIVSMDFIYLAPEKQEEYKSTLRKNGIQLIVVGLTFPQLFSEVEVNLAITSSQSDPDDVDALNVDKYPD